VNVIEGKNGFRIRGCKRNVALRTHDLIRLKSVGDLQSTAPLQDWVLHSLCVAPYVVVRRRQVGNHMVSVGIRGPRRDQRLEALLPLRHVSDVISPEFLVTREAWLVDQNLAKDCGLALRAARRLFGRLHMRWGPIGSVGFHLASRWECISPQSDLDIVLRVPESITRIEAESILSQLDSSPLRLDIQAETSYGAFSLREFAESPSGVLIRSQSGACIVDDPWHPGSRCADEEVFQAYNRGVLS
jgi:phosphoribosyl-dephospho-CoA transferase